MYANAEITKRKTAVGIEDIRDLILHIIGDAPPPNWVKVQNARAITKIVAILVPGLTPALLNLPPLPTSATANPNLPLAIPLPDPADPSASAIPWVANTFSHACPTRAPGEPTRMHSVLSAFFHGPVSGEEKRKRMATRVASERAADKDPSRHALSLEQMVENDYPIPSYMADIFQKPDSMWVETPAPPQASLLDAADTQTHKKVKAKVYAIDCEMCLTEDGKELTRVCVIDYYSGAVVYDQLVKPPKPIVDYLTQWSGITKEALEGVTTTLPTVQAAILALLVPAPSPTPAPTPILLGHSLESDLRALKLCHPACIDTALTYHHPRGRPLKPGLAWLTRKWCGRVIQARGAGGHDPEEDARACVELLRKKLENGAGFGEFKTDFESIFERLSRSGEGGVKAAVVDHGNPGVMHGAKAGTCVGCTSDSEVVDAVVEVVPGHEFVFGRLTGLAAALGWLTPKDAPAPVPAATATATPVSTPAPPPAEPSAESLIPVLTTLNTHLTQIHASLPPRTALVLFTGHADPRRMAALQARKNAFEAALRAGKTAENIERELWWTAADGRELEEEVEVARRGVVFLGIK
ncbi:ribonuclease H-like protein [Athelia psychrophila]|uniref:Ribonuclease H-like protein n=1 Tax=Athelia psychrophila TaxID=1759441 RepID=A0A166X3F0_9AGAM|nr:ribonuclease H-like protein [Fibularhizoctonia sp. CBS 109695]